MFNAAVVKFAIYSSAFNLLGHTGQHLPGGVIRLRQSGTAHRTTAQSIGGSDIP